MVSELSDKPMQDGHHHLYRYSSDGSLQAQLTQGDWQVRSVLRVDVSQRCVYFRWDKPPFLVFF
jgi:hypothetical protein